MFHEQINHSPSKAILNQQTIFTNHPNQDDTFSSLKDAIISMEYRIKTLEAQINGKMEREECLTLLERKSSTAQVKKGFEEIYAKIQNDRLKDESNIQKMEQEQKQKINELKKKLKEVSNARQGTDLGSTLNKEISSFNFTENMSKKLCKTLVKPQELYLESNETMFSMIIDEIKDLKQSDSLIERLIESKHKKTVSLNNEVCRKLQNLERELEQTVKYVDSLQSKTVNAFGSAQNRKFNKKEVSKRQKQQQLQRNYSNIATSQAFDSIRLQLLSKSMQSIQKELTNKINIRDIVPLIKQNVPNLEESLNETKAYFEENFESMRKILENQSQINQEISKSNRVAWWHCYEKMEFEQSERSETSDGIGYIMFSKEIMNIIPQSLIVEKDEEYTLKVLTKGWYLIHVYALEAGNQSEVSRVNHKAVSVWIEVNNGVKNPVHDKQLMNLAANSQLRIITQRENLFVQVQRL